MRFLSRRDASDVKAFTVLEIFLQSARNPAVVGSSLGIREVLKLR
jgi:hypothetical protein